MEYIVISETCSHNPIVERHEVAYTLVWPSSTTTGDFPSKEALLDAWPDEEGVIVRKTVIVEQIGRTYGSTNP